MDLWQLWQLRQLRQLWQLTENRFLKDSVEIEELDLSVVGDAEVRGLHVAEVNRVTEDRLQLVEKLEDGQSHRDVNPELRKPGTVRTDL